MLNHTAKLLVVFKGAIIGWLDVLAPALEPTLFGVIQKGFPKGDDAFDGVVGLFGMIEVFTGRRRASRVRIAS